MKHAERWRAWQREREREGQRQRRRRPASGKGGSGKRYAPETSGCGVRHRIQSTILLLEEQIRDEEQELRELMFELDYEEDETTHNIRASLERAEARRDALEQRFVRMLLTPERYTMS